MKKLLYLCGQLPFPLDTGQKIVTMTDLRFLSRRFDVDVLGYVDRASQIEIGAILNAMHMRAPNLGQVQHVNHPIVLQRLSFQRITTLAMSIRKQLPYIVAKYVSDKYRKQAVQLLSSQSYDALYIDHLAPSYVPLFLNFKKPIIYRAHDYFSETLSTYANQLPQGIMRRAVLHNLHVCERYEKALVERADLIPCVTKRLAHQLQQFSQDRAKIFHMPVAYDKGVHLAPARRDGRRILYAGTVHYPPNRAGLLWFLTKCWPLIRKRAPGVQFDLVGRGGRDLGSFGEDVHIHDYVEDLNEFYEKASVFIVPLFAGSGIRLKILDAFSSGLSVVSTPMGYMGLEVTPGENLLVAENAEDFSRCVTSVLEDDDFRASLARSAHAFLRNSHAPELVEGAVSRIDDAMDQRIDKLAA